MKNFGAEERTEVTYLNTCVVANFDVLDELTTGYDNTCTLVSTDQRQLGCQWPVTVDGVEIGVADARVLDVHENLIWAWLCYWDLLVDDSYRKLEISCLKKGEEGLW